MYRPYTTHDVILCTTEALEESNKTSHASIDAEAGAMPPFRKKDLIKR
jgi:hypothetical protein